MGEGGFYGGSVHAFSLQLKFSKYYRILLIYKKQKFIFLLRGWVGYVSCVVELFTMTSVVGEKEKNRTLVSSVSGFT